MPDLYTDTYWSEWASNERKNYTINKIGKKSYIKKGYIHFDDRLWFPDHEEEIKKLIENNLKVKHEATGNEQYHSFTPFIKRLIKTPRYKYQEEEGVYGLETKIRPICYASHKDSLILGYYSFVFTKLYEEYIRNAGFENVVLAYRSDLGKSNIQFAKDTFSEITKRDSCSAIALDIKGYFDHIDHKILLEKWQKIYGFRLPKFIHNLYKILTKYSYINYKAILSKYKGPKNRNDKLPANLMRMIDGAKTKEKFESLKKNQLIVTNDTPNSKTNRLCGIPQGSPISALLSNIYLIDFDKQVFEKSIADGFIYKRYCDDIIVICDSAKAKELADFLIDKIYSEYFLTIQPRKVELIDFKRNSSGVKRAFKRPHEIIRKGNMEKMIVRENSIKLSEKNERQFYKPLQYLGFEYDGQNIRIRSSSLSKFYRKLNYRLQRTIIMSYSPKSISDQIFLRQIYERYTHLGQRNFLTYAYKASKKYYKDGNGTEKEGMNSPAIRRQLRNHFSIIQHELQRKNIKWFSHKSKRKKKVNLKWFPRK